MKSETFSSSIKPSQGILASEGFGSCIKAIETFSSSIKPSQGILASEGFGSCIKAIETFSSSIKPSQGILASEGFSSWIKASKDVSKLISNTLENVNINELTDIMNSIQYDKIHLNEDGTIEYLDEAININDFIDAEGSWEHKLDTFLKNKKCKHPIVIPIIIYIFLKLFVAPFYECYLDRAKVMPANVIDQIQANFKTDNDKNKLIKDIKKEVNINNEDDERLKSSLGKYRFVTIECLNVRSNASNNSRIVYKLELGQVVEVLKKERNWTLVKYTEGEDVYVQGWVYTRYLSKFK